jgi:hypothetical protein
MKGQVLEKIGMQIVFHDLGTGVFAIRMKYSTLIFWLSGTATQIYWLGRTFSLPAPICLSHFVTSREIVVDCVTLPPDAVTFTE